MAPIAAARPIVRTVAPSNMDAAASVFGGLSLANGSGAENAPMGIYTFSEDAEGYPALIGGAWSFDDAGALTITKELYDAPGASYDGKPKSVKMVIILNQTGVAYRLSASALQTAFKTAGLADSFAPVELSQVIDETAGYSKAIVKLA